MPQFTKTAPKSAQIQVAADGCRNIPKPIAVKVVGLLFENIGLDRLRESSQLGNVQFNEVGEFSDLDLCDAMDIGFKHLSAQPVDHHARAHQVNRIEEYIGTMAQPFAYRVGQSYTKGWPAIAHPL
jgi:hypothetical protein